MAKLTPKQARFVEEYLVDLNASKAALRAGYSPRTAKVIGHENLNKPYIAEKINFLRRERSMRTQIDADRVLEELARIAFADMTAVVRVKDGHVEIEDTADLSEDQRRAIAEIGETVTDAGGSIRVRFHDKQRALELLGKHLGLFERRGSEEEPLHVKIDMGSKRAALEEMITRKAKALAREGSGDE